MTSVENEPLNEVLRNYDLKVKSIRNETYKEKKGVWWIETDNGLKVLKKISNSEDTLKYILSAVNHLMRNGVLIPKTNLTKNGAEYAKINETCYVLSDAVEGKNPAYDVPKELEAIAKGMAKFHKASIGFKVLPDTKPKVHLGTWIDDYIEQIEDMNSFYNKESYSLDHSELSSYIVEHFPFFYKRAINVVGLLKGSEYENWNKQVNLQGGLCHQDFAAGNLILNGNGLYVLDTDSITIDIGARDIRKLINKVLKKKGKWDIAVVKLIFESYQSVYPLTYSQWQVVKYDLTFPHLFIGAMNKYFYQRDKEWSLDKYFKRIREMCEFEKSSEKIINEFDTVIPVQK